jgi:integrase/recombinase XerC
VSRRPRSKPSAALVRRREKSVVESFWEGKSPRTVKAYKEDMERLASWSGQASIEAFAMHFLRLRPGEAYKLAHEFRAYGLDVKKWSPSYVNNHLAALRSLVKFARQVEFIEWAIDIKDAKAETYRDTRGPGFAGLVALVSAAAAQEDPWTAARDVAIVSIFASMALRRDEVVGLDVKHVDLRSRRLSVKRKKKLQRVWVTLPVETADALEAWLLERGREAGPLFISRGIGRRRPDGRLAESSVWKVIRDLGRAAGIKAWPHALRHAAITEVLNRTNGNMRAAQTFAAHGSPNTTQKYDDARKDVAGEMAGILAKAIREARETSTRKS